MLHKTLFSQFSVTSNKSNAIEMHAMF